MLVFALESNLKLVFIPYFDWVVGHSPLSPVFGHKLDHNYRRVCAQSRKKNLHTDFQAPEMCIMQDCDNTHAKPRFYLLLFHLDEHVLRACLEKVAKLTSYPGSNENVCNGPLSKARPYL